MPNDRFFNDINQLILDPVVQGFSRRAGKNILKRSGFQNANISINREQLHDPLYEYVSSSWGWSIPFRCTDKDDRATMARS